MFEYDEFGNPIRIGTATASTMGDGRRNAAGAFTGQYPGIQPGPIAVGGPTTRGLMPTMQIPITGISAGNQNDFEMQGLPGQAYGLGGATDYTGGFNTTGTGNFVPGLAGMQPFDPAPEADISLTSENPLFNVQSFGNAPEADIPLSFPDGPTSSNFPQEFRSLPGIEDFDMAEEADIPLAFDPSSLSTKSAGAGAGAGGGAGAGAGAGGAAGKLNLESAGMIAGGVMGVAGGITDIVQGGRAIKSAQSDQRKQQAEIDRLKASQPSLSTPAEYYERVKGAYDARLMQMRTEDINKNLANTTAAATSFGSRGLGALAGATQQANRAQRQEVLQQQQLQTAALGDLAGAQERSIGLKEARNTRETTYAQNQLDQAEQAEAMARQQRMAGIASTVGGVAKIGMGVLNPVSAAPVPMEKGGKVQKTPGKFSHDENEMAVITEEGEDTGVRVTGGEYVLNPDQASSIKKLVEAGDKDALMKFMDGLLDEPQFA